MRPRITRILSRGNFLDETGEIVQEERILDGPDGIIRSATFLLEGGLVFTQEFDGTITMRELTADGAVRRLSDIDVSFSGSPLSVSPDATLITGANARAANRYNVNLPVSNPAGSLAFMVLGSDYIVDLELSAAQSEGKGEIISQPRITAANQQEAVIAQGTEIPYQEAASSGAATIQFKPAKLELRVTPRGVLG